MLNVTGGAPRFRFVLDPVCLAAWGLYAANALLLKPAFGGSFFTGYLNDLLLIPAALPPTLWLQGQLRWRPKDLPPTWPEILMHLAVWATIAEAVVPRFAERSRADILDVAAYAAGAIVSGLIWHAGARDGRPATPR